MNRKGFLVLMVVAVLAAGSAFAQATGVAQKIVGTWIDQEGGTWVFSADGNLTITSGLMGDHRRKYAVTDTKLFFDGTMWDISMSADGKTLLFSPVGDSDGIWLTKK